MVIKFESEEAFKQTLIKDKTKEVTDCIVQGISKAMQDGRRSADIFTVYIEDTGVEYEISLPSKAWVNTLQECLDTYYEMDLPDDQIDCWKLMEAARVW